MRTWGMMDINVEMCKWENARPPEHRSDRCKFENALTTVEIKNQNM